MYRVFLAIIAGGFLCLPVRAQQASLSGTVTFNDGSTAVESLLVVLENSGNAVGECYSDASGSYTMSVNAGSYDQLRVRNLMRRIDGIPYELEYTAENSVEIAEGSNTVDIVLSPFYTISGTVLTTSGDTVKAARIECGQSGGFGPPRDQDISDETDGSYSLVNSEGSVHITVFPPEGSSSQESSFDIELVSDTVFDLIMPVVVNLSGVVLNHSGDTIKGIGVTVEKTSISWQVDSFSNEQGKYSVPITPGTVNIRIRNGSQMNSPASGAPAYLEETVLTDATVENDTDVTIILPYYPVVRCSVITDEGQPIEGVSVKSSTGDMPEMPLGDKSTTDGEGKALVYVEAGSENNLWFEPPEQTDLITAGGTVVTEQDTTLVVTLNSGVVLSGTVYLSDGVSTVGGIGIALERGAEQLMTYTNVSGNYSIQLEPDIYQLRVRNTGTSTETGGPEGVPQNLEHTVSESIDLSSSQEIPITLPYFPAVSGMVYNSAEEPVEQATISFARWFSGADGPPYGETTTDEQGYFRIIIGAGINRVHINPPEDTDLGSFTFLEQFDTSAVKELFIPDLAKGVTRVQPSVVTRGESGRLLINGINIALDQVNATDQISFGDGVEVDSIKTVSAITLYAYVSIAEDAESGTRNVHINTPAVEAVGPSLLTITAPAEAEVSLDSENRTTEEIIIGDGTGTELIIPEGTGIELPTGADPVISYKAPIIEETAMEAPVDAQFTQVQRELSPAGLQFNDSVVLKCQYSEQDIEDMDELSLEPYIYDEAADNGEKIQVVDRDTAANTIAVMIPHFSVMRLTTGKVTVRVAHTNGYNLMKTEMTLKCGSNPGATTIVLRITENDANSPVCLKLLDLRGRVVKQYIDGIVGSGSHTVLLSGPEIESGIANGNYILQLKTKTATVSKRLIFFR